MIPSFIIILCPRLRKKNAKSAIFSLLGKSCTRYKDMASSSLSLLLVPPWRWIFFGDKTSATFLLASNINSSISLFASPRSLVITCIGAPFLSRTNRTSSCSNEMAPFLNLSLVRSFARLFKIDSSLCRGASLFLIDFSASS